MRRPAAQYAKLSVVTMTYSLLLLFLSDFLSDDLDKVFFDLNDDLEAREDKDYALFLVFFLFDNIELNEPYELLFL